MKHFLMVLLLTLCLSTLILAENSGPAQRNADFATVLDVDIGCTNAPNVLNIESGGAWLYNHQLNRVDIVSDIHTAIQDATYTCTYLITINNFTWDMVLKEGSLYSLKYPIVNDATYTCNLTYISNQCLRIKPNMEGTSYPLKYPLTNTTDAFYQEPIKALMSSSNIHYKYRPGYKA